MPRSITPMIPLGYGTYARADKVYAIVPLTGSERGDGRRTLIHVEGIDQPLVASRSEMAIAAELAEVLGTRAPGERRAERLRGQEPLF